MRSLVFVCALALIAVVACQDFFVSTMYSDSSCTAMIGRRATNFYQKGDNCSTVMTIPTCTAVGTNYVLEQCLADPPLTPEASWVTMILYNEMTCDTAYAYYMAVPDQCTYYNYVNTFTLTACASGQSTFSEGSNNCNYTGATVHENVGATCVAGGGIGLKVTCPGQSTPMAAGPTSGSAPQAGPTSGNTPQAATPAKKSSAATLGATALVFATVLAF